MYSLAHYLQEIIWIIPIQMNYGIKIIVGKKMFHIIHLLVHSPGEPQQKEQDIHMSFPTLFSLEFFQLTYQGRLFHLASWDLR